MATYFLGPADTTASRVEADTRGPALRLYGRVAQPFARRNVFRLTDLSITETQPEDWDDVETVWWGGHLNPVTDDDVTALTAAGYAADLIEL